MKANIKQLLSIESLKKDFCLLSVGNYGFYSNGSIGVLCTDIHGEFCTIININGKMSSRS
tara:strand:- start:1814 stop:1993 length:180 start_codon:yes stop_codon:yes gene_type:complete